jgi:hypothetical protein
MDSELLGFWTSPIVRISKYSIRKHNVSETGCFLVLRNPNDGQSAETQ